MWVLIIGGGLAVFGLGAILMYSIGFMHGAVENDQAAARDEAEIGDDVKPPAKEHEIEKAVDNQGRKILPPKAYDKDPRFGFLDFTIQANTGRTQGIVYADNHLGELPLGVQLFAGVPFLVQDRYMLFGKESSRFEHIGVGGKFVKLHVCHGAHFYGGNGELLAHLALRYTDGASESLPVRYRRDVVNYWTAGGVPTHAKVAWRGSNRAASAQGCGLALFLSTYDNPRPEKTVSTIDYIRANEGQVTTFCIAMTVERE